jgi:hypothetical protein
MEKSVGKFVDNGLAIWKDALDAGLLFVGKMERQPIHAPKG